MSETPEETRRRVRDADFRGWQALRDACREQHPPGPGGAAVCVCGRGCGGSAACGMLATLRDVVRYLPTGNLPAEWRDRLDTLRSVM